MLSGRLLLSGVERTDRRQGTRVSRVSIQDVARVAGVSTATVSRVLTGVQPVRPHTAEAVHTAVAQLNYRPNQLGRALRRQATQVIGMIVPRVDNPFFPTVVQLAEAYLREENYALLLCTSDDQPQIEASRVEMLVDRQVDGLLISPCHRVASAPALRDAARRVPVVQLDRSVDELDCDYVGVNDRMGIRQLVEHARAGDRPRLAYIGGANTSWSGAERQAAFNELAPTATQPTPDVRLGQFSQAWGHEAALDLLSAGQRPDAVICGNDLIALGVVEAAADLGLSVPGDLGVGGYDDIDLARLCRPPLTTVRQPVHELTHCAIDRLLSRLRGLNAPADRLLLDTELVVRDSLP